MSKNADRIAVVGATSLSHGRRVVNDLLSIPALDGFELALMAPLADRLRFTEQYARRIIDRNGLRTRLTATSDLPEALRGARYVVTLFDVGGPDAYRSDYAIAARYGVDVCIGDSLGPTGIMKAARNIGVLREIAAAMARQGGEALLINYVNPMAMLIMAAARLGIGHAVGVCGGVAATRRLIARRLEVEEQRLETLFAGINHMCWALSITSGGVDLYPAFKRVMQTPEMLAAEPARSEVLQQFGYFPTETSGHLSDLLPWFRASGAERKRYCPPSGYAGATGAYLRYAEFVRRRLGSQDHLRYETGELAPRSSDAGAAIIEAIEGGQGCRCYGDVMNTGPLIGNLPEDACVEVPLEVEAGPAPSPGRLRPTRVGRLPPQLAALSQTNITVQQLAVEAVLQGDPELLFAAVALDPLVSAVLDLPSARAMTQELLGANAAFLPWFRSLRLPPTKAIDVSVGAARAPSEPDELIEFIRAFERKRR